MMICILYYGSPEYARLLVSSSTLTQWMQLRLRKQNMRQLFERMQRYQFEKVREQPDKALTEDTRALQDDDVQRSASLFLAPSCA